MLAKWCTALRNLRPYMRQPLFAAEMSSKCQDIEDEDSVARMKNNPYKRPPRKCFLCEKKIELNYKNARLLQQFVSSFSGRVYDR